MNEGEQVLVVLVTAPKGDAAETLAKTLVDERLAACANLLPGVRSIFHWQGQLDQADETLVVLKTRAPLFGQLSARIQEIHEYDVPEVLALSVAQGSSSYLEWVREETRG